MAHSNLEESILHQRDWSITPEKRLWYAVLETLVHDIDRNFNFQQLEQHCNKFKSKPTGYATRINYPIESLNRIIFLVNSERIKFICELIGLNHSYFKRKIIAYIKAKQNEAELQKRNKIRTQPGS